MRRRTSFLIFVPIAIMLIVVDRLTKLWAADTLRLGDKGDSSGLFDFVLVHNQGAAFGIGSNATMVFVVIAFVIVAGIILWLSLVKKHTLPEVVALGLVTAGAVGNCIDRITDGYVVDFLHLTFIDFPVFNIADICLTSGTILLIIVVFSSKDRGDDAVDG